MSDEANRNSIFFLPGIKQCVERPWRPEADVYRCESGWLIKFDLAGIRLEDIRLTARGPHLMVEGVRRDWILDQTWQCYSLEISYCRFERTVTLPFNLEKANIETEYKAGILLVRIQEGESNE